MGIPRDFDIGAHNARVAAWKRDEAKRSDVLRENKKLLQVAAPPAITTAPCAGAGPKADAPHKGDAASKAPSKYRNKPTNGYASKREAERAFRLKLMQEAGAIRNLREQVKFLLIPKQDGERACSYIADFSYEEPSFAESQAGHGVWREVVEDCKGMRTDVYVIKRKLMQMVHGIKVRET